MRFGDRRRRLLMAHPEAAFLLPGALVANLAHDVEYRYRQDPDLYYLTGWTGAGTVALLRMSAGAPFLALFVEPRDPEAERWTGPRPGPEGARLRFGADEAFPRSELKAELPRLLLGTRELVYPVGRDRALDDLVFAALSAAHRLSRRSEVPSPAQIRFPGPLLGAMRVVKDMFEQAALRKACATSAAGVRAAMAATRPGVWERDIEGLLELTFRRRGAQCSANPSIVGAGANTTVLHYSANQDRLRDGEFVLVDAGAEQDHYVGDVTRTYPINGRFTPPQRQVYQAVLDAQRAAVRLVRPGTTLGEVHRVTTLHLVESLCRLGVLGGDPEPLVEKGAHRPFFPHPTSHWLGLDVHDPGPSSPGDPEPTLESGMVLTVEPGLYFPLGGGELPPGLAGLGVRIEDDLLVTATGAEVLTQGVPSELEEVEDLVGSQPLDGPYE